MADGDVPMAEVNEEEAQLRKTAYKALYERSITLINQPELDNETLVESEKIQKASTKLTKDAETAQELVVDMKIMMVNSNYLKKHIEASSTNLYTFRPSEYADHIIQHMKEKQYMTRSEDYDWSKLMPVAAEVFIYKCPIFFPMLGMFEIEDTVGVVPANRKPRETQEKVKAAKELKKVTDVTADKDGLDTILKKIQQTLGKVYKQNNSRAIHFLKFVIDPQSFSRSVENIFHVSFLVRDGVIKVAKDDNGEITISPVSTYMMDRQPADVENRRQFIFTLSVKTWEEAVKKHKILMPVLKPNVSMGETP